MSETEDSRDILEGHGLHAYRCEPGTPFASKHPQIINMIPTSNPEKDQYIKPLRWGFRSDEKVIRPEWDSVLVYKPQDNQGQSGVTKGPSATDYTNVFCFSHLEFHQG